MLFWPGVHDLAQDGQFTNVVGVVVGDDHDFAKDGAAGSGQQPAGQLSAV